MMAINSGLTLVSSIFLLLALGIGLFSLMRFSSILVKLVVIEVIVNLVTSGLALWALVHQQGLLLDICVALVLVMFLSTVAYCQFTLGRGEQEHG